MDGLNKKKLKAWMDRIFQHEMHYLIQRYLVMAIIADFMLVWLPAPTVSLSPPLTVNAGPLAKFFYSCPDNAFQVALVGTSYSFLQRIGAIVHNGSKFFVVGTSSSLVEGAATEDGRKPSIWDTYTHAGKFFDKSI